MSQPRNRSASGAVSFETYSSPRTATRNVESSRQSSIAPPYHDLNFSADAEDDDYPREAHSIAYQEQGGRDDRSAGPSFSAFPPDLRTATLAAWVATGLVAVLSLLEQLEVLSFSTDQVGVIHVWIAAYLGLALWLCTLPLTASVALEDAKSRVLSADLCIALSLLIMVGSTLWGMFADFDRFLRSPLAYALLPTLTLVLTSRLLAAWCKRRLLKYQVTRIGAETVRIADATPGTWRDVPISNVDPGDVVRVEAGDTVPLDMEILAGGCEVRERRRSGFSVHRIRNHGQMLYAGSTVLHGSADCRVVNASEDSGLTYFTAALSKVLDEAIPSDYENFSRLQGASLAILIGALLGAGAVYLRGGDLYALLTAASSILLVTFVPLVLGTMFPARRVIINALFQNGALVRSAAVIEKLARCRTLFIDYPMPPLLQQHTVVSFDILDERVERGSIVGVLLNLLSASEDEIHTAISRALRPQIGNIDYRAIRAFQYHTPVNDGPPGISGTIEGIQLVFGSESFLLERGVHIQASDFEHTTDEEFLLFLSVEDDVVARLKLRTDPWLTGSNVPEHFRKRGVRTLLMSELEQERLDSLGKAAGFELSTIHASLSHDEYASKLRAVSEGAFFSANPSPFGSSADVTISRFNDVLWETELTDVTLMRDDWRGLLTVVETARLGRLLLHALIGFACLLSLVAYFLSLSPFASPPFVASVSVFATTFCYGTIAMLGRWALRKSGS